MDDKGKSSFEDSDEDAHQKPQKNEVEVGGWLAELVSTTGRFRANIRVGKRNQRVLRAGIVSSLKNWNLANEVFMPGWTHSSGMRTNSSGLPIQILREFTTTDEPQRSAGWGLIVLFVQARLSI